MPERTDPDGIPAVGIAADAPAARASAAGASAAGASAARASAARASAAEIAAAEQTDPDGMPVVPGAPDASSWRSRATAPTRTGPDRGHETGGSRGRRGPGQRRPAGHHRPARGGVLACGRDLRRGATPCRAQAYELQGRSTTSAGPSAPWLIDLRARPGSDPQDPARRDLGRTSRGGGHAGPSGAQQAEIDITLTRLADEIAPPLPKPWSQTERAAVRSRAEEIPGALGIVMAGVAAAREAKVAL